MDQLSWQTILAVFTITIITLKAITGFRSRKLNHPPGPKPWPIIGNLHLIGPLPHHSIHELSKKYGPLMHLQLGSSPVLVGSSVEMAKLFLKTHDKSFISRPRTAAGIYTTHNCTNITWSPYGPYWRQARKMCLMELFSAKRLESFEYIRVEEIKALLQNLFRSSGNVVVLKDYLSTSNLHIISRMVLGKNYVNEAVEGDKPAVVSPQEFMEMLDELFLVNGVMNIGDFIPWLDFLDLQGYVKRMKMISKKWDRFLEHVLDEHNERRLKEGEKFVVKDMVDVLLQLADDPNLEVKLERHGILGFTQDLIAGGTETSSVTVEWGISELLRHPHIFDMATEELDRVIGRNRWIEEKDMHQLPFIEAIMKETMRLHPVVPLLIPRLSREDVTINGYNIAAGTRVLVNVWTIGRDPSVWEAPDEFRPQRFIGSSIDVKGHDYELLPFGAGRRMCPGYNLGLKVIQVSFANLLHGFKWSLPKGKKNEELNMEEIFGLSTPRKFPLEVIAEPKLPAHLYGF